VDDELNAGRGLVAAIALTVIAMAAFLVLPLYVGAAAESLGLSQQQLGFLASAVAAGSALSSVVMMFLVRRLPWRPTASVALLLLLVPMCASIFVDDIAVFMVLQGLAALGSGAAYSLALTALADRRHPDRAFGFSVAAQVTFQVVGMLLLPQLVARAGIDGILGLFIAMELVGLYLVRWLPKAGKPLPAPVEKMAVVTFPVLLALFGCFFFFFNVGAVWTYIERMAVLEQFSAQQIGSGLAIGVFFGIPGALLASWCGDRFGRVAPLTVGAAGTVIALLMLSSGMSFTSYVVAVAIYNFVWNFSLAFQYAAVNAVDPGGSGVAAAPAFHGAGVAVGPACAALFVTATSLGAVNVVGGLGAVASLFLFIAAIALAGRSPTAGVEVPDG
jgi:predicted MFS family arabinose efflux permease